MWRCRSLIAAMIVSSIPWVARSEEHTSELQSQSNLVCRLLLEKKNTETANLGHNQYPQHPASLARPISPRPLRAQDIPYSTWIRRCHLAAHVPVLLRVLASSEL